MIHRVSTEDSIFAPEDAAKIFQAILSSYHLVDQEKENFWVLGRNTQGQCIYVHLVHVGTLDTCQVHPREIFRLAVMEGAHSIITCHNHPSGNVDPSPSDRSTWSNLDKAGEILRINVLDHQIISHTTNEFYSANAGLTLKT